MAPVIRVSREEDIAAITAIYGDSVLFNASSYEYDPPDEAEMARRRGAVLAGGFPYLIAELDGKVAGYAYAGPFRPRVGYRFTVENSVYIDPACVGRGIGKRLLMGVIDECEKLGFRQMIAVIGDRANVASIKLHESCGFRLIGVFPSVGFKFGRWVDSVQMQRTLGEGDSTLPN